MGDWWSDAFHEALKKDVARVRKFISPHWLVHGHKIIPYVIAFAATGLIALGWTAASLTRPAKSVAESEVESHIRQLSDTNDSRRRLRDLIQKTTMGNYYAANYSKRGEFCATAALVLCPDADRETRVDVGLSILEFMEDLHLQEHDLIFPLIESFYKRTIEQELREELRASKPSS